MRILQVHNYYQQSGGEDIVVAAERELLLSHGNEVRLYEVSNDAVQGTFQKIQTAWQAPYSIGARDRFAGELASYKPDLVHAHNTFPLLTASIYDACRDAGVPVVQTLHNYRTICPGGLLLRDDKVCEECLHGSAYRAGWYRCYRDSVLGSLAVARMVEYHRSRNTWREKVDCFIALTDFAKEKFVQAGFPADKIAIKPNFIDAGPVADFPRGGYALFVGRLSREKGAGLLLEAWEQLAGAIPLKIVGEGPLGPEIAGKAALIPAVEALGRRSRSEVLSLMRKAMVLVLPSLCYEGLPMTVVEAYSVGLPVIASDLGSMSSLIDHGRTGLHFRCGDARDLAGQIEWILANPDKLSAMRLECRAEFEAKYTAGKNYQMLMDIYQRVIKSSMYNRVKDDGAGSITLGEGSGEIRD